MAQLCYAQPVNWNLYAACYDLVANLAPYQDMLDEVVAELDLRPGMRVLDAGCGTGALAARLARRHPDVQVLGVDLSAGMVGRAQRRQAWPPGFRFRHGSLEDALDGDGEGFDRIASVNVIWALGDPALAAERMARRLRTGGRMVHTTPRWRFRFDVIVLRHLRQAWSDHRFGRALLCLPLLAVAGLLNLGLVLRVLARTVRDRSRWQADGLARLFRQPRLRPPSIRPTYAGQGFLVVCDSADDSSVAEDSSVSVPARH